MTQAVIVLLVFFSILLFAVIVALLFLIKANKQSCLQLGSNATVIVYATQSGFSEQYAQKTAEQLHKQGQPCVVISAEHLKDTDLLNMQRVIFMLSTYGEGDAPDTAQAFKQSLVHSTLDLSHLEFAVLAFGDDRYTDFCAFGQHVSAALTRLNAKALFDVVSVNQQSDVDLAHWNSQLSQVLALQLDQPKMIKHWQSLSLKERTLLNAGSLGTDLYHLKFAVPSDLQWKSGDILELRSANSNHELAEFFKAYPELSQAQIKQLRYKNLRTLANVEAQNIVAEIEHAADLPLREYSIASIPEQGYLDLVVRQEVLETGLGLGSGLLTQKLAMGETIQTVIRSNPAFHLHEGNAPCIFIGNGSGIAGLLSHLQQRILAKHTNNWLIFGERQQQCDAIFKDQLAAWQAEQQLTKLDLAYSRDQGAYRYVQDVLLAEASELKAWIAQGAYIYVCGSLKGMAKGVDGALLQVLGQEQLDRLKAEKRYRRDVY